MRILRILAVISLVILSTSIFQSCEKDESLDLETISQAEEVSFVDNIYEDIAFDVDNAVVGEVAANLKSGDNGKMECATVTVETPEDADFPRTITIDFGEEGCTTYHHDQELVKKGKIIIELTGEFFIVGSSKTVTFEDFYINDNKIEGQRIVTNNGANAEGNLSLTCELKNGKVTTDEGVEITREYVHTKTWVEGSETIKFHKDDIFLVEGYGAGTNSDGISYTREITTPILISRDCPWFKSGVVENNIGEDQIIIDFGDGECDNIATKSVNGEEPVEFEMERKYKRRFGSKKHKS